MAAATRRRFLKASGLSALLGAMASLLPVRSTAAPPALAIEKGAKLRLLRWKRFVQGDEEAFLANTRRFTELTGVEVKVESENWEEVRPKAAVAANVGAGPDIVIATDEDPHQYPNQLLDVTDVAEYLGAKYGGWYDVSRDFGMHEGRWVALPMGAAGGAMVYRRSHVRAAGFDQFPQDFPGFLRLCKALKARGTPAGFALGHATGDANAWCNWVLWGYGGRLASENMEVVIDSPQTVAALEYASELYRTFALGAASWLDPSNNKAFLAGEISLTINGISIYYTAKTSSDARMKALAADIQHAGYPVGPAGVETRGGLMFPAFVFKYSRYPNAAKEYLRFMMEKEQYERWQAASIGYISHTLRAYENNPIWNVDPQYRYFRDIVKSTRHYGYAGKLGQASAAATADFVVVDMFAEACTGTYTPKEAAQRAQKRALRHYQKRA